MPGDIEQETQRLSWQRQPWSATANRVTSAAGSLWAGVAVLGFALVWAAVGLVAGFPRWWELVVTVGLPILTLGLVIVVQHTQNHDNRAMHLKLDELIRSVDQSSNIMMRVEEASADELERLQAMYQEEARRGQN